MIIIVCISGNYFPPSLLRCLVNEMQDNTKTKTNKQRVPNGQKWCFKSLVLSKILRELINSQRWFIHFQYLNQTRQLVIHLMVENYSTHCCSLHRRKKSMPSVVQVLDGFSHWGVPWFPNSHGVPLFALKASLYSTWEITGHNHSCSGARRGIQPSISRDSGQPSYLLLFLLFFMRCREWHGKQLNMRCTTFIWPFEFW